MKGGGRPAAPPLPGGGGLEGSYPSVTLPSALDEPPQQQQQLLSAPLLAPSPDAAANAPPLSYQLPAYDDAAANNNAFASDLAVASARVRNRFVAKVFALLLAQLGVVAAVAFATPKHLAASPGLLTGSAIAALVIVLILSCSEAARRAHPVNVVLLAVFSACQGLLVASATAGVAGRVVLDAVLVTAVAVAGLTAFAFWRAEGKGLGEEEVEVEAYGGGRARRRRSGGATDFAAIEGMLFTALMCLLIVTSARAFLPALFPKPVDLLISGCSALLFCAYVCWDVERLLSDGDDGGGGLALGADDYVLAVLTIEVDVVNLFLYVLDLLRQVEGDGDER